MIANNLQLLKERISLCIPANWDLDFTKYHEMGLAGLQALYRSYLFQHLFLRSYYKDEKIRAFLDQVEARVDLDTYQYGEKLEEEQMAKAVSRSYDSYMELWYCHKIEHISKGLSDHGLDLNMTAYSYLMKGSFMYKDGCFYLEHLVLDPFDILRKSGPFKEEKVQVDFELDPNDFDVFHASSFFDALQEKIESSQSEALKAISKLYEAKHLLEDDLSAYAANLHENYSLQEGIIEFECGTAYIPEYPKVLSLDNGGSAFINRPENCLFDGKSYFDFSSEDYEQDDSVEVCCDDSSKILFIDYSIECAILEKARADFYTIKNALPGLGLSMQLDNLKA